MISDIIKGKEKCSENDLQTINELKNYVKKLEEKIIQNNENLNFNKLNDLNLQSSLDLIRSHKENNSYDHCEENQKLPSETFENIKNHMSNWIFTKKIEIKILEENNYDKTKSYKNNFYEKEHIYRESLLSVMFRDKNLKMIYSYTLIIFFWLMCWLISKDYLETGSFIDRKYFVERIELGYTLMILFFIYIYCLLILLLINRVHQYYQYLLICNKKKESDLSDIKYVITLPYKTIFLVYSLYIILLYIVPTWFTIKFDLPMISSIIVGCELVRCSLKSHAYFRDKLLYGFSDLHEKYINYVPYSKNKENEIKNIPDIKISNFKKEVEKFYYYLFCPTLIYRDSYPRLPKIRINLVISHLFNFICCILFFYIIMRYNVEPFLKEYTIQKHFSIIQFVYDSLTLALPGTVFLLVGFFMFLHTWMNLHAELMKFGDRKFYEDWWNVTNFEEYYRKWNMVVHEWLYYYIYNDTMRFSLGKYGKNSAKFLVFFISVIVHEIVVWYALRFFYPILGLFFGGPGIIFTYIKTKNKNFNIVFWFKLFLGIGIILSCLLREFHARSKFEKVTLLSDWHVIFPKSILIYFDTYSNLIN